MKALGKKPPELRKYSYTKIKGAVGNLASKQAEHYRTALLELAEELEEWHNNIYLPQFPFFWIRIPFHNNQSSCRICEWVKKARISAGEKDDRRTRL